MKSAVYFPFIACACFISFIRLQAQQQSVYDDCINVREIYIPFDYGRYVTSDTSYLNVHFNQAYYLEEDEYTFWYKLIAADSCEAEFQLLGTNGEDQYDFMLYRFSETNFCQAVVDRLILPVNDNNYALVAPSSGDKKLQAAYQDRFQLRAGDVYYISVMHISGPDCGHLLFVKACGQLLAVSAVKKPCFVLAQPAVAEMPPAEKLLPSFDTISVITSLHISGRVIDNDNGRPITAMLLFEDAVTADTFRIRSGDTSGYTFQVERGREYTYKCSALGYETISGHIAFSAESKYDFFLNKMKTGERFVMDNIYFYPNTFAFRSGAHEQLDELLLFLQKHPDVHIEIQGHTAGDTKVRAAAAKGRGAAWAFTGSAKKLSKMRAEAVKKYLIAEGISAARLRTRGFGSDRPLIPHPRTQEERMKNMRVEILITVQEEPLTPPLPTPLR